MDVGGAGSVAIVLETEPLIAIAVQGGGNPTLDCRIGRGIL